MRQQKDIYETYVIVHVGSWGVLLGTGVVGIMLALPLAREPGR